MKVSIYTRPTINGRRQYVLANRNSKGPFFLRYEEGGKRFWQSAGTNTWTFALAAAREKEGQLLRGQSKKIEPKPSAAAPKTLEEHLSAFLHDKRTSRKKDGSLRDPETIESYEQSIKQFLTSTGAKFLKDVTRDVLRNWKDALYDHPYAHWTACNIYSETCAGTRFTRSEARRTSYSSEFWTTCGSTR